MDTGPAGLVHGLGHADAIRRSRRLGDRRVPGRDADDRRVRADAIPATIDTLLDNALGPLGYYGVFTANMHTDSATSSGADAIVASAQARNVPVVSARQMLDWLDGRNASSFGDADVERPRPHLHRDRRRDRQRAAGDAADDERGRSSADLDHAELDERGIHDADDQGRVRMRCSTVLPGHYTATYTPDTTPPVISGVAATATPNGDATITWTTNEASSSSVAYGTNANSLSSIRSDPATGHVTLDHDPRTLAGHDVQLPRHVDRSGGQQQHVTAYVRVAGRRSRCRRSSATDTTIANFTAGTAGSVRGGHARGRW